VDIKKNLEEYIVTLKSCADLEQFYSDLETLGGDSYIPSREVECCNRREISRNTHYLLTPEEAETLKNDNRVLDIIPKSIQDMMFNKPEYTQTSSNWNKSTTINSTHRNWGLLRCTLGEQITNWGSNGTTNQSGTIRVTSSGKNVDVVVVDGHLDPTHPEFAVNSPLGGNIIPVTTTHNELPIRGFLYFPTSGVSGTQFDVVVLYHPTITTTGVTPITSAENFLNITLNQINIKDKIIFSVAYPQDAIPDWEADPSLPEQQFPGIDYPNFYLGDNIAYAEASLLWVKNGGLNTYFTDNNIPRSINKIFTFGHSQGAYLTHRLNTMHAVDGIISNAPGPIDLLTRCSGNQNTINVTCNKIRVGFGSTAENPSAYDDVSLKNF